MELTEKRSKQKLLPNKSIRYDPDVYDFLKDRSEAEGINVDKLVRRILKEWMETSTAAEITHSDLLKELKNLKAFIKSQALSNTPKPEKPKREPIKFNFKGIDTDVDNFFSQLDAASNSKSEPNPKVDSTISKLINKDQLYTFLSDHKETAFQFFMQNGFDLDNQKEILLEGKVLEEFESIYGLVEELPDLPF